MLEEVYASLSGNNKSAFEGCIVFRKYNGLAVVDIDRRLASRPSWALSSPPQLVDMKFCVSYRGPLLPEVDPALCACAGVCVYVRGGAALGVVLLHMHVRNSRISCSVCLSLCVCLCAGVCMCGACYVCVLALCESRWGSCSSGRSGGRDVLCE